MVYVPASFFESGDANHTVYNKSEAPALQPVPGSSTVM
jgi:hypothetical protein